MHIGPNSPQFRANFPKFSEVPPPRIFTRVVSVNAAYSILVIGGGNTAMDAVVTAGLPLGASRMSGSDKQTYYKMGISPDLADSPESFAKSLTAGGCCHGDLALASVAYLKAVVELLKAGGGSKLLTKELIAAGDWTGITQKVKQSLVLIQEIRSP